MHRSAIINKWDSGKARQSAYSPVVLDGLPLQPTH